MALDNFRTIELIWDKANKSIIKTIKTASSDTTGRYFSVKILDDGQEVDLTGAKLQLYWEHPNFNTNGIDNFTTVDTKGKFTMTFSDEMLTNIGELTAYLVLTLTDGKITSDGFPIKVFKGADNGVVVPTNGSGLVEQIDGKIDKGNVTLNDLTYEVLGALAGGGPENVFNTLSELKSKYPNGSTRPQLVLENGHFYIWNGNEWVSGGVYQSSYVSSGVDMTNIIKNGNFADTSSWTPVNGAVTSANNELTFTVSDLSVYTRLRQSVTTAIQGHVYYVRGDIFPKYNSTTYIAFGGSSGATSTNPIPNQWNKIADVVTAANTSDFNFYHNTATNYAVGDTFKYRKVLVVDLTATYGQGNEPSKSEFEALLEGFENSWFDGNVQIVPPMTIDGLIQELGTKVSREELEQVVSTKKNIITVKKSGGDFTNLREAMSATVGASKDNQYEVQIEEGTYDLMTMYTRSEIESTSFVGLLVPNNVSLVGISKKVNTIIKMEIPDTWLPATIARVAPIANQGAGELRNITVIGKNCRYTVHDDYGYSDTVTNVKNCTFIKLKSLGNSQAWGEGSFSGQEYYFEDTEFITEHNHAPYSTHNNLDFDKPSYHSFKNCKFINAGGYFGMRFISLDSGVIDKVDIEDCYIDGIIKFEEYAPGNGCMYDLTMHGSSEVPISIDATDGSQPTYTVIEETKNMMNVETTTITKGTPVKLSNDGAALQRLGNDDISLFYGVAMQDIEPSGKGMIKIKGYIPVSDTGLELVRGDKVGVVGGALAKVTTGDYVAIANQKDFVKLKF